jgi:hypothetical protein
LSQILSGLYLISALTDFVSFCISEPLARINFMTKFSLAMACLGFIVGRAPTSPARNPPRCTHTWDRVRACARQALGQCFCR